MKKSVALALAIGLGAAGVGIAPGAGASSRTSRGSTRAAAILRDGGAIVVDWNRALLRLVRTPGAQPATVHPTRSFALLQAAIYDAVLSVVGGGRPYLLSERAPRGARPDAAAAAAGHDSLAALYPGATGVLDELLAAELTAMPDGPAKTDGVRVGQDIAARLLAARADDGSAASGPPVAPGTTPGAYRPTPPKFAPPVFTGWGSVTPFVLAGPSQFRPAPPPSLTSRAYTRAVNEVRAKGRDAASSRTADQSAAAQFWAAPIWNYWNEIAQGAATRHHTDLVRTARLFAVLDLSLADDVIAFYDAKYHYALWRPVTAIREAADDGNPNTTGDPTWNPLAATPADPSYPGAHSAVSAAAATVLASFFGDHDRPRVTSEVVPGAVRTFRSYQGVATEAGLSRIDAGVHTRLDHRAGVLLGRRVATYVLHQSLSTRFGPSPRG